MNGNTNPTDETRTNAMENLNQENLAELSSKSRPYLIDEGNHLGRW